MFGADANRNYTNTWGVIWNKTRCPDGVITAPLDDNNTPFSGRLNTCEDHLD
jgi:hypothetical protein